ncbi:hypothetical protein NDU88_004298, partial [Pleurodeles waltl]
PVQNLPQCQVVTLVGHSCNPTSELRARMSLALMGNVFHFCVIAIPLVFALAILAVITDSILTKSVPSSDT